MKKKFNRIYAIVLMDHYYMVRNLETFIDIVVFPAINIIVFGLLSLYLIQNPTNSSAAQNVLTGSILWEIFRIAQYTVSINIMWNIWSRNLTNIMLSPISTTELFIGSALASFYKSMLVSVVLSIIVLYFFKFNIFDIGIVNLIGIWINLAFFAVTLGIVLLGFIYRYGTRMQAITWGVVFLFQPISATIFPLDYLPEPFRSIALILPTTHMFEMARNALAEDRIFISEIGIAFVLNLIWGAIFLYLFNLLYRNARRTGQFARNEG